MFCDYFGSMGIYLAVLVVVPSVASVCLNFTFFVTAATSLLYLRVAIRRCNYIGGAILSVGLTITSMGTIYNPDEDAAFHSDYSWIGIVLAFVATIFYSFQYVYEESLFTKYSCSPLYAVGIEGAIGCVASALGLVIVNLAGFENTAESIYQLSHNGGLFAATAILFVSTMICMLSGQVVTIHGSSLLRVVLGPLQTALLFIAEVTFLKWAEFDVLTCCGLAVTLVAILSFNNLIWFPISTRLNEKLNRPVVFLCLTNPDAAPDDSVGPYDDVPS